MKWKLDVLQFPWPWEDSSVDEIHCSHFIEHIPMELRDGQDLFFAFFDEVYRVLKPEGSATFIWPDLQTTRAFMDPTHRRFIPKESMLYLNADWRKQNRLDHYRVKCNFAANINHSCMAEMTLLHPEAQARRFNESWNTKIDNIAVMKPIK